MPEWLIPLLIEERDKDEERMIKEDMEREKGKSA